MLLGQGVSQWSVAVQDIIWVSSPLLLSFCVCEQRTRVCAPQGRLGMGLRCTQVIPPAQLAFEGMSLVAPSACCSDLPTTLNWTLSRAALAEPGLMGGLLPRTFRIEGEVNIMCDVRQCIAPFRCSERLLTCRRHTLDDCICEALHCCTQLRSID